MRGSSGRRLLGFAGLQLVVILYTSASLCAKAASGCPFFSPRFFAVYALELVLLGCYAVLWQQAIKKIPLSVAYANRGAAVFWALLFSALIFRERVTPQNIAGVVIIFGGIFIINSGKEAGYD